MKNTSLIGSLIISGTSAVLALVVAFGVDLTVEQMTAILGIAGFAGVILALILWSRTVDRAQVVERLIGDHVVAGEANDMVPAGREVRRLDARHSIDR